MSEFKCQEPGCGYHIGIGGPVVTDEDFEQQDYYFQEIEDHQQMHDEQKRVKPGTDKSHPPQGGRWLKVDDQPLARRLDGEVVLIEFDSSIRIHVPLQLVNRGFELRVDRIGISEQTVSLGSQNDTHAGPLGDLVTGGSEPHGFTFSQTFSDDVLDRGDGQIIRAEDVLGSEIADNESSCHQISLSVGGAPNGAVGGTSESTERDQTPDGGEKKKHPAAVTAGCCGEKPLNTLLDAVKRLERNVDVSNANSSGLHLSDDKGEDAMLGNDDVVQDIDLISERCVEMLRGGDVNAQSQVFVGFQESSPSVDGPSNDAGVGTYESTEGDQPRGVGEKKKHPAAVTAGCDETKTNGKQGSDFNV